MNSELVIKAYLFNVKGYSLLRISSFYFSKLNYPFFNAIMLILTGNIFVHSDMFMKHPGTMQNAEDSLVLITPTLLPFGIQQGKQIVTTVSEREFRTRISIVF